MPDEPEALGLLALMLLHDARRAAASTTRRAGDAGGAGPHALGSGGHSREGSRSSRRPCAAAGPGLTGCRRPSRPATPPPPRRPTPTGRRSPPLRRAAAVPSAVVALNRAVAVAMAEGPAAGLELVEAIGRFRRARRLPPAAGHPRGPAPPPRPARARRRPPTARRWRWSTDAERRYLTRRLAEVTNRP